MKEFKGKVAVITGAASGIGLGLAQRCAKEGMKVVLADIEADALARAESELKANGADVLAAVTDVSKESDVRSLAQKTLDTFGAVHLLCNNAGVSAGSLLWESTLTDWQWVMGVNLWGVIHGVKVFVPLMLKQQTECHIVNTASIAGVTSGPGNGIYSVTKHAVVNLSETLYFELELVKSQIGVSVLCPGFVRTQIIDSFRNRPLELQNSPGVTRELTSEEQAFIEIIRKYVAGGKAPEQIADQVFQAVRKRQLYILTHPVYKSAVKQRVKNIVIGRNPRMPKPMKIGNS